MRESLNEKNGWSRLLRVLPLYVAAYAVLLCGLGAYVSTYEDETFGIRGVLVVLCGLAVSLFCRLRQLRQNTMFGILAGMVVVLIFWISVSGGSPPVQIMTVLSNGRNNGPGMLLAWFLVLYSFAMIADEVIIFSVVPSIALLGLMASDNLNPEVVIYFLGLVVSAVFLLVYENMLSRGAVEHAPDRAGTREAAPVSRPEAVTLSGEPPEPAVRTSLFLTAVVAALALMVGFAASLPLSYLGQALSDHTPQINLPAAADFASTVSNRYINQLQLDGTPPRLSDRVVMQVHAQQPYYWRSKVFSIYTGFSWTSNSPGRPIRRTGFGEWELDPLDAGVRGEMRARVPSVQRVQLLDPPIGGLLVAASEPMRVWIRSRRGLVPDSGRSMRVMSTRGGISYAVLSMVSAATPDQLRHAGTNYPLGLRAANTLLEEDPDNSPAERHDIAERITAPYNNPYDKVKALERYLQDNYLYSLTPPRTPRTEDAVTFFLTKSRQGYCEIFASSMAVLAREVGIPARLATGFAPGNWQAGSRGEGGYCVVREKDLHAWTEVYFPGYGWIPFDPTSSRQAKSPWTASFQEFLRTLVAEISQRSTGPTLVLLAMMGIALFVVKVYAVDPLRRSLWWRALLARHRRTLSPDERWDLLYAHAYRRLRKAVGLKPVNATPFEFADSVRERVHPEAAAVFDEITRLYVDRSFRREGLEAADVEWLIRLDSALRRALRNRPPEPAAAPASA